MDYEFNPDGLTELPFGLPGKIYRSPMPFRPDDMQGALFSDYRQAGVNVVVVLADRDETVRKTGRDLLEFYREHGLYVIHCPIPDFRVPESPDVLQSALDEVGALAGNGKNIAVHCYAGFGRTGLFMGCLAKRVFGFSGKRAIQWVRGYIPTALENEAQEVYVLTYGPGEHYVD